MGQANSESEVLDVAPGAGALEELNRELRAAGMSELAIVDPFKCVGQEVNARYMDQQTLANLTKNVARDGRLESTPLVYRSNEPGKYHIISGHHRVESAQKAGLKWIIVMVVEITSESELRAKQLSHNSITGKDDEALLKKMYESIDDIELRYYSGLQDALDSVSLVSLNFRAGNFKEFTIAFMDPDIEEYDRAVEDVKLMLASRGGELRLDSLKNWEKFSKAIREVRGAENIKSNGAALSRLVELAKERLAQIKAEQDAENRKDDA